MFLTFDPQGLPENICKIAGYRNGVLEILIIHCSKMKEDRFKGITNSQNPDVDEDKTHVQWQGFKHFMYLKLDVHHHKIDVEKCNPTWKMRPKRKKKL